MIVILQTYYRLLFYNVKFVYVEISSKINGETITSCISLLVIKLRFFPHFFIFLLDI